MRKSRLRIATIRALLKRRFAWPLLVLVLLLAGILAAYAQLELPRSESRFTLARVQFDVSADRWGWGRIGDSNGPPWSHDFPRSEENLMKIMAELTRINVNPGGHLIRFDSEDCFKYPIAYLAEAGYLNLSEKEIKTMREYLLRGGFLIVDDFRGRRDWYNFAEQMRLVFPDRNLEELPRNHPIFTCFYDISNLSLPAPYSRDYPQYFGMKGDDDRLMMVVSYNTDISEYWEFSADPFYRREDTNEAFKFGVNFIMYALTH